MVPRFPASTSHRASSASSGSSGSSGSSSSGVATAAAPSPQSIPAVPHLLASAPSATSAPTRSAALTARSAGVAPQARAESIEDSKSRREFESTGERETKSRKRGRSPEPRADEAATAAVARIDARPTEHPRPAGDAGGAEGAAGREDPSHEDAARHEPALAQGTGAVGEAASEIPAAPGLAEAHVHEADESDESDEGEGFGRIMRVDFNEATVDVVLAEPDGAIQTADTSLHAAYPLMTYQFAISYAILMRSGTHLGLAHTAEFTDGHVTDTVSAFEGLIPQPPAGVVPPAPSVALVWSPRLLRETLQLDFEHNAREYRQSFRTAIAAGQTALGDPMGLHTSDVDAAAADYRRRLMGLAMRSGAHLVELDDLGSALYVDLDGHIHALADDAIHVGAGHDESEASDAEEAIDAGDAAGLVIELAVPAQVDPDDESDVSVESVHFSASDKEL